MKFCGLHFYILADMKITIRLYYECTSIYFPAPYINYLQSVHAVMLRNDGMHYVCEVVNTTKPCHIIQSSLHAATLNNRWILCMLVRKFKGHSRIAVVPTDRASIGYEFLLVFVSIQCINVTDRQTNKMLSALVASRDNNLYQTERERERERERCNISTT